MKIWKFTLKLKFDIQGIQMPIGAEVISVGLQRDEVVVWAICQLAKAKGLYEFKLVQTGGDAPLHGKFLGTVQRSDGIVLHVWHFG